MVVCETQQDVQGGERLPVVVSTDEELDRLIKIRLDQRAPLPKDIAFGLVREREFLSFFERYGLHDHSFIRKTAEVSVNQAMAAKMRSASHADQVAHYVAGIAQETSSFTDMRKIATGQARSDGVVESGVSDNVIGTPLESSTGATQSGGRTPSRLGEGGAAADLPADCSNGEATEEGH